MVHEQIQSITKLPASTHGSGVYIGSELWRMYCVQWNTRKARPAKKSRDERYPATGRNWNPVRAATENMQKFKAKFYILYSLYKLLSKLTLPASNMFQ